MESEFISWLRHRLPSHPQLRLGPGDDAAIVRLADRADCVVTTDLLADGVHFELDRVDPRRAGRKALAVNLSDLAAMAAQPLAAFVSLLLPQRGGRQLAEEMYEGMLPLAEKHNVAIAGGDTNSWSGPLVISVTAVGKVSDEGPLLRSGARPGDQIVVTGRFGGSILGRQFDFDPRIDEALRLHAGYDLHAAIDVSDGVAIDLQHIARESRCGALCETSRVPVAEAAGQLAASLDDGSTALDHALGDGEDFELILAVPPDSARRMLSDQPLSVPLTRIGEFIEEPGLWKTTADGGRRPLAAKGFQHPLES